MFRQITHHKICAACRLHQAIAAKQLARAKASGSQSRLFPQAQSGSRPFSNALIVNQRRLGGRTRIAPALEVKRAFHTTHHHEPPTQDVSQSSDQPNDIASAASSGRDAVPIDEASNDLLTASIEGLSTEQAVHKLRQIYGDRLPDGLLDEEQGLVWERLYGRPLRTVDELEAAQDLNSVDDGSDVMMLNEGEWEEVALEDGTVDNAMADHQESDRHLEDDVEGAMEDEYEDYEEPEDESVPGAPSVSRLHPLTIVNRFSTEPSTLQPPKDTLTDLISILLSSVSAKHITQAAHRIFGGFGLPNSTSTPRFGKVQQQTNIPLDVSQYRMSDIEADVYTAVLMTAVYSSTMSVLVETRKRLGTAWAEDLVRKAEAGKLRILDAGGAGMGVLAVRDMLKAEWERMHEEAENPSERALATPDGKLGGAGVAPPLGNATVFIASEALRHRASHILVNTTFVPRMPDYLHTTDAKQAGKYDIIVAPHTIWPIREPHARRAHISNLWSLLNARGGVLCLLEKGVARGFEAIAGARQQILRSKIASSEVPDDMIDVESGSDKGTHTDILQSERKEAGMIIAPCTNHVTCPMYKGNMQGTIKGRKDICHFRQRYIRPPFLQKILGARDKNFEDIKISYLSVMRGGDLRATKDRPESIRDEPIAVQGETVTAQAFDGYMSHEDSESSTEPCKPDDISARPSSLSLPRTVLPPLKRRGHVILDMCTPAGEIERWTVPRSYSKQAFHDARKSEWGDLWALGAKTRVSRTVKLGKHARKEERDALSKKVRKEKRRIKERKAGRQGMLMKNGAA